MLFNKTECYALDIPKLRSLQFPRHMTKQIRNSIYVRLRNMLQIDVPKTVDMIIKQLEIPISTNGKKISMLDRYPDLVSN